MKVRLLPDPVIDQIAAGEVVERPASVVKELVENSLDAGATRIDVVLKAGGVELIRITDDGSGMDREDAMMCLERHATSKLTSMNDLTTIGSLGFRGEAVPSIASVSRFTLSTCPHGAEMGVRIKVEGGVLKSANPAGCAPGTQFDIRDLFFNLPARRKFLRSRSTELAHCQDAVLRQALIRPDVAFRLTHDGRVLIRAEGTDLPGRARQLLGKDALQLVPVEFERDGITVTGLASPISVHRPSGKSLYLFVNGRFVRDSVVRRAISEAYRDRIPRGRSPMVVLDIRMDPSRVDVNVHPAKTEVRFRDPRPIQEILATGVRHALSLQGQARAMTSPSPNTRPKWQQDRAPTLPLTSAPAPRPSLSAHPDDDPTLAFDRPPPPVGRRPRPNPPRPSPPPVPPSPVEPAPAAPEVEAPAPQEAEALPAVPLSSARELRPIGPFGSRWMLCEGDQELVVVDVQRADVLLTVHRMKRDGRGQRLLVPDRQRMSARDAKALMHRQDELAELGLEMTAISPTEWAIRSIPSCIVRPHLDGLLAKLAVSRDLPTTLAESQTPLPTPDLTVFRSMLLSLEELELDAVTKRVPAKTIVGR